VRLFLAAALPEAVESAASGLQSALRRRLRGWRWPRPEGIHLTLRFLGEVDAALDERARAEWERVAAECRPFRVGLDEVGHFPPRGVPRVLWIGLLEIEPGGALAALARQLEATARELGWAPERRPFRPHLTLGRARKGSRPDVPPGDEAVPRAEGWVRGIRLVESRLLPEGARYTARAVYPLGGGEPPAGAPGGGPATPPTEEA
jgi:2'-5' RNA ligase